MRGYYEVGVYNPKHEVNVGTLWRSAYQCGASGIFTIGRRWSQQSSDTVKAWKHVPMRNYSDIEDMVAMIPYSCQLIGVEMGGEPLRQFSHPERAVYLLGAEDNGLPADVLRRCVRVVSIEALRTESYNLAVAGSIVMWHRLLTRGVFKDERCA